MSEVKDILDSVQPDFTPDGVWELILLMTLGEQFNLVWHAGTEECKIVYDMEDFFSGRYFEYEFGTENVHFFNAKALTEKDKQELLSWQTVPKVELKQDSASVEFCMFKPFGGFFMIQNQIQFKPHLKMKAPVIMKKVYYPLQIIY